jgi:hypothetical protein
LIRRASCPLSTRRMRDEVTRRRAGIPRKEAQKLAFHVGYVMRVFRQSAILLRTEEMHDGVDQVEDFVRGVNGFSVDNINFTACHSRHYQPKRSPQWKHYLTSP